MKKIIQLVLSLSVIFVLFTDCKEKNSAQSNSQFYWPVAFLGKTTPLPVQATASPELTLPTGASSSNATSSIERSSRVNLSFVGKV